MNSQICLFWWMKLNKCTERWFTATFLQLGPNFAILLNQSNFSAFKFSSIHNASYCFAIKAIKHKISKVFTVTCVFVQIEQSSCTIWHKNGPYVYIKLLLPCTSVNAYSPKQSSIVFPQLLCKFSWLALNIKNEHYPPSCLLLATSADRNADLD